MSPRRSRRLAATLERAASLPGYARTFHSAAAVDADPARVLAGLPVLERDSVQERPEDFSVSQVAAVLLSSSGSTGVPLSVRLARSARRRRQRQFARFFLSNGWRPWDRALCLKVLPDSSARLGSSRLDASLFRRRRVASVLEPSDRLYALLQREDPAILHGLPSVLEHLAARAEAEGWRPRRLRRTFTSSEALSPAVRRLLERALGAPVVDSFAAAEALIGFECELRSGIHVIEDDVIVEVVDEDGTPVPAGAVGRVVITTLANPAMPLVRYAIGDLAIAPSAVPCPCGRPGMVLPRILGRQVPLFEIGGASVSPWGVLARMHELEAVRQFQLVQAERDVVLVLVRTARPGAGPLGEVRRLVEEQLGPSVRVRVREVPAIEPLASGKAAPALVSSPAPAPPARAEEAGVAGSGPPGPILDPWWLHRRS
jgi:phenylacetate-CoA ligase